MFHKAEVKVAHKKGGGEPAQGQKHSEYKAFDQYPHVDDERDVVSFIK